MASVARLRIQPRPTKATLPRKTRSLSPSATPATQNARRSRKVPRLPRTPQVHVAKCHACHAQVPRRPGRASGPKRATGRSATPAKQNESRSRQVPHLPRQMQVHVAKCHTCHAKVLRHPRRSSGPKRATRPSHVSEVPRLPRKTKAGVDRGRQVPRVHRSSVTLKTVHL